MKVFVVWRGGRDECANIEAAFTTEELANAYLGNDGARARYDRLVGQAGKPIPGAGFRTAGVITPQVYEAPTEYQLWRAAQDLPWVEGVEVLDGLPLDSVTTRS